MSLENIDRESDDFTRSITSKISLIDDSLSSSDIEIVFQMLYRLNEKRKVKKPLAIRKLEGGGISICEGSIINVPKEEVQSRFQAKLLSRDREALMLNKLLCGS